MEQKKPGRIDYSYRPDVFHRGMKAIPIGLHRQFNIYINPGDNSVPATRKTIKVGSNSLYLIADNAVADKLHNAIQKGTDNFQKTKSSVKSDTKQKKPPMKQNKDKMSDSN